MSADFFPALKMDWVLALRAAAVGQFVLVVLNLGLARWLNWKPDIERMPLLIREVFQIHSWFIMLVLLIWSVMTWRFAAEMIHAPTAMSRWFAGALAVFWGLRTVMQWTHYSSSHWRGRTDRTVIHWVVFISYGAATVVYGVAASQS